MTIQRLRQAVTEVPCLFLARREGGGFGLSRRNRWQCGLRHGQLGQSPFRHLSAVNRQAGPVDVVLGGQKPMLQMLDSSCPLESINNGMETGERMASLYL